MAGRYPRGAPVFVTRGAKESVMRPTLAAPTMTRATDPTASLSRNTATRSLRAKRRSTVRTDIALTG